MKLLITIMVIFNILYAQKINEKIILSADKLQFITNNDVNNLEIYFDNNHYLSKLKAENHLSFHVETLGEYTALVLKPIKTKKLKNKLILLLKYQYPDAIAINDSIFSRDEIGQMSASNDKNVVIENRVTDWYEGEIQSDKSLFKYLLKRIDMEWLALFALALAGLILVIRSAYQIHKIKILQNELRMYQKNREAELNTAGVNNG